MGKIVFFFFCFFCCFFVVVFFFFCFVFCIFFVVVVVVFFFFFFCFFFQAGQCTALSSFRAGKWYFIGKRLFFHESAEKAVISGEGVK